MFRYIFLLVTSVLLFVFQAANAEESVKGTGNTIKSTAGDTRQLVSMPEQARTLMMGDMLGHLSALNNILGNLALNKLDAAADIAENEMGKSSMGKHRSTGMGPGMFMPLEMRNIAWGMHSAATEFAQVAKKGNLKDAYSALQKVTGFCVNCHYSYRTR